jgi:beta-lactamase class A
LEFQVKVEVVNFEGSSGTIPDRSIKRFLNYFAALILIQFASFAFASSKVDSAKKEIEKILSDAGYRGGIAIKNLSSGEEIVIRGDEMFPMASVYKFPIAIAVLKKVEEGEFKLDQKFHLKKSDILNGLRGPIAKKYPNGEVDLTLEDLLKFMVSDSDNSACDFLIKAAGGPSEITATLRKLKIENVNVSRPEAEIMAGTNDPGPNALDATTPRAMIQLYAKFHDGKVLDSKSTAYLSKLMMESNNPPHILNGLPKDAKIAHKSGWCDKDLCVNDTAIITLPNNKGNLVMAIFLNNKVEFDKGSATISKIAKIGFDNLGN